MTEKQEKDIAKIINKTLNSEGWQYIETWLKTAIENHKERALQDEDLDKVSSHVVSSGQRGIKVVMLNFGLNYHKNAARVYREFLGKVKDWKEIAEEK